MITTRTWSESGLRLTSIRPSVSSSIRPVELSHLRPNLIRSGPFPSKAGLSPTHSIDNSKPIPSPCPQLPPWPPTSRLRLPPLPRLFRTIIPPSIQPPSTSSSAAPVYLNPSSPPPPHLPPSLSSTSIPTPSTAPTSPLFLSPPFPPSSNSPPHPSTPPLSLIHPPPRKTSRPTKLSISDASASTPMPRLRATFLNHLKASLWTSLDRGSSTAPTPWWICCCARGPATTSSSRASTPPSSFGRANSVPCPTRGRPSLGTAPWASRRRTR